MKMTQKHTIYLLLTFVMASWGLNVSATKIIVMTFTPILITSLRLMTAAICIFIILFLFKKLKIPTKREFLYIFLGGLLNVVGHHYFLALGLNITSASNGGLILGLGPIMTTIFAFFLLRNRPSFLQIVGVILGFIGVAFTVLNGNGNTDGATLGDLYIFLSVIAQTISFIIIKKATTLDPLLLTGYMLLVGSVILFLISFIIEPHGLSSIAQGSLGVWLIFFASAIIASALGQTLYNYAIGKVGVVESSIFLNLTPFFSLIGAAVLIGEKISFMQVTGFILILIGVLSGSGAMEEILFIRKGSKGNI